MKSRFHKALAKILAHVEESKDLGLVTKLPKPPTEDRETLNMKNAIIKQIGHGKPQAKSS